MARRARGAPARGPGAGAAWGGPGPHAAPRPRRGPARPRARSPPAKAARLHHKSMRTIDDLVRDRTTERRGGAVRQEPLDAYLARVDHVSASALRRSLHTAERAAALRIEDDPSQRLAQALHALVLEPARFAREYFVLDRDAPTPSGDEQPDAPAGRVWLSSGEYAALVSSRDAIRAYPRAPLARWLDEG